LTTIPSSTSKFNRFVREEAKVVFGDILDDLGEAAAKDVVTIRSTSTWTCAGRRNGMPP
jgi:hypothetical protein